ncbi:hypothetical protein [Modestobacter sp. I12A-02662]|uniref:hypothetical protein n=1 Tax=Modestobacter sp. I12A-02662 TaxID=1730496 RepID=UPI0034DF70AB
MLSRREQRVWDDVQRFVLVLLGAPVAGLAIGAATVLGWALWHTWPQLGGQASAGTWWNGRTDGTTRRPAGRP